MLRPTRARPTTSTRRRLVGLIAASLFLMVLTPLGTAPTYAATDRLPNLRMGNIADARIQTTSTGRRLLRLSTHFINAGPGPLELRGSRKSTSQISMTITQRIRQSDGSWRVRPTGANGFYAGDGHDHWHIANVQDMSLLRSDGRWVRGAKIGFCFFDTGRYLPSTPGSPGSRGYFESTCGRRSALTSKMGISVGWGDKYQWSLAYQWIDVTGVGGGTYLIRTTADPLNLIQEASENDNCGWASVRFATGGSIVTVITQGKECVVAGTGGTGGGGGWSASADAPASLTAALGGDAPSLTLAVADPSFGDSVAYGGASVASGRPLQGGPPATGPPAAPLPLAATTALAATGGFRCTIPPLQA
jgi:hypothetical protein